MRDLQRRVNQKLSFARWHLEWSEQLASSEAQYLALMESTVFHIVGAYRSFLAEIVADQHHEAVATAEVMSHTAVGLSAAYSDYLPPALAECLNLEQRTGWLSELLCWYGWAQCVEAPWQRPVSVDLITAARPEAAPDSGALHHCLAQLESLIERLRSQMQEC